MHWIGIGFLIAIGFGLAIAVAPLALALLLVLWELRVKIATVLGVLFVIALAIIYPDTIVAIII